MARWNFGASGAHSWFDLERRSECNLGLKRTSAVWSNWHIHFSLDLSVFKYMSIDMSMVGKFWLIFKKTSTLMQPK